MHVSNKRLSRHGNIYFSSKRFPGCESFRLHGAIDPRLKAQAEERFVIGPVTEDSFWDGQRREMSGIRGPCKHNGSLQPLRSAYPEG